MSCPAQKLFGIECINPWEMKLAKDCLVADIVPPLDLFADVEDGSCTCVMESSQSIHFLSGEDPGLAAIEKNRDDYCSV